jgi:tRNA pseudouridine55 synthase
MMVIPEGLLQDEGGVLLVDKPQGWTSFDVVNKIRKIFHLKKVGHAGTLDPLATGLLILCSGRRLKSMESFVGLEKEYEGTMTLGVRTKSFDSETDVVERRSTDGITEADILRVFREFTGDQEQLPPMWSAAKVRGKPLYRYARAGRQVERTPRTISIRELVPTVIEVPRIDFRVVCSKGTYVRSLVEDIGLRLGCGACVTRLRRTRIGEFQVRDAQTVEQLIDEGRTVTAPIS